MGLLFASLIHTGCAAPWDPGEPGAAVFEAGAGAEPWTHLDFANDPDDFQFVVITDRTGGHRPGVFPKILERVNLMQPELVMSVGDYIEGYTEDRATAEAEWAEVDAMIKTVEAPFFHVAGNHDYSNEMMAKLWEERMGRPYYYFVYRDVLFVALNSEDPPPRDTPESQAAWAELYEVGRAGGREAANQFIRENELVRASFGAIGEAQLEWVLSVLAEHADVRWTLFFVHKPVWQYGVPHFTAIEDALGSRGYTMFAGHEHSYLHTERRGRDYMRLGTTGGGWDERSGGRDMDQITWVTMRDDGPIFAHLVATGILAKDQVPNFIPGAEFCGEAVELPCVYSNGARE
jgi:hypothetical protein